MAKRRARPKPPPAAPEPDPRQLSIDQPAAGQALRLFPHDLQVGDLWRDEHGADWRVVARPHTYREGKRVGVRVALVTTPTVIAEKDWAAHERVQVRRE